MSALDSVAARLKLEPTSIDRIWLLMGLLTVAGLGVSAYLMWGYTAPGATLACGGSHGCETVKNSVYANFLGIPVPLLGLAFYAGVLLLLVMQKHTVINRNGWSAYVALALFAMSLMGVLYSAYLTYVELFIIHAICRWCVASALITVFVFLLSIFNLRNSNQLPTVET